jgi:hypothetical protein
MNWKFQVTSQSQQTLWIEGTKYYYKQDHLRAPACIPMPGLDTSRISPELLQKKKEIFVVPVTSTFCCFFFFFCAFSSVLLTSQSLFSFPYS